MSTENDPLHPKKKKTQPRKKTQNNTPAKEVSVAQRQIDDIISQAFTRFYTASNIKQSKLRDLQHLDVIVAEYLQSFMILGYDINGEKVCITHASTPAARDSLIEHLRSTFVGIMNNGNE